MKRIITSALVLLLLAGACFCAEEEAILGNLSKMGVTEEQLNADLEEVFFAHSPFTSIKFFDSLNSMLSALGSGRIAAFTIDKYTADYLIARTGVYVKFQPAGLPVYNMKYSMLLREEDEELCRRISSAIRDMKADGTLDALKKKYIDDCIAGIDPEAVKPEHFEGAETLRVALTGDRPPMDYISEAGEAIGFNTALVSEIARRLKMNAEFISIDTGARASALQSRANEIFYSETADYNNREGYDTEDMPAHTIITESYLGCTEVYVTLPASPLLQK